MVKRIEQTGQAEPAGDDAGQLQQLAAAADAIDSAPPPLAPGEAPPPTAAQLTDANVHAIVGALQLARKLAAPRFAWWAQFGDVWSDAQLRSQAEALEGLRAHMGWEVGELLDRFGPWIAITIAFGVPVYATWDAIEQRKALQAQAPRAEAGPTPAPPPTDHVGAQ